MYTPNTVSEEKLKTFIKYKQSTSSLGTWTFVHYNADGTGTASYMLNNVISATGDVANVSRADFTATQISTDNSSLDNISSKTYYHGFTTTYEVTNYTLALAYRQI